MVDDIEQDERLRDADDADVKAPLFIHKHTGAYFVKAATVAGQVIAIPVSLIPEKKFAAEHNQVSTD